MLTVVQVAGEGGMGEDDVVEVGVELECWKISSSALPAGDVVPRGWATGRKNEERKKVLQLRITKKTTTKF